MDNLAAIVCSLQNCAHEGMALHKIKVHLHCKECDTDITIENPDIRIEVDHNNNVVNLEFANKKPFQL